MLCPWFLTIRVKVSTYVPGSCCSVCAFILFVSLQGAFLLLVEAVLVCAVVVLIEDAVVAVITVEVAAAIMVEVVVEVEEVQFQLLGSNFIFQYT